MEKHMRTFCKHKKIVAAKRKGKPDEERKTDSSTLVSFDEKLDMTERIRKVSVEVLASFVKTVQAECPQALQELDSDRIQIKLDSLDKETFDKLYK